MCETLRVHLVQACPLLREFSERKLCPGDDQGIQFRRCYRRTENVYPYVDQVKKFSMRSFESFCPRVKLPMRHWTKPSRVVIENVGIHVYKYLHVIPVYFPSYCGSLWTISKSVIVQMKAIVPCFLGVLLMVLHKMVLSFESADKIIDNCGAAHDV